MKHFKLSNSNHGFTLIEVLIIIGIISAVFSVVISAINPAEKLAQSRDSIRIQGMNSISSAISFYYTTNQLYPSALSTWMQSLVDTGNLKSLATSPSYSGGATACSLLAVNSYCYWSWANPSQAVLYIKLESKKYIDKCSSGSSGLKIIPFAYWSAIDSKVGLVCKQTGEPTGNSSTQDGTMVPPGMIDF